MEARAAMSTRATSDTAAYISRNRNGIIVALAITAALIIGFAIGAIGAGQHYVARHNAIIADIASATTMAPRPSITPDQRKALCGLTAQLGDAEAMRKAGCI